MEDYSPSGRWPANVILDESQAEALDQQSGIQKDGVAVNRNRDASRLASDEGWGYRKQTEDVGHGGQGGASRFFYVAKPTKRERPQGDVTHPTVKPLKLMRYLVRLVTPEGGTVLDPFAGGGSTLAAALAVGYSSIGIELSPRYFRVASRALPRLSRLEI